MARIFEHILIPYNGTTGSNKAFRKTVSLASSIQAKITVLTCLEERPAFGFFKTKTSKQEFEKEHKLIEKQHLDLEKLIKKHDIPFSSKIVKNGMASVKILEFANSMKNFVQFKERPEEFAKYLKDVKGVDIAGNSGIVKAFLIFCVAMIAIFGWYWLYNRYKNGSDNSAKNRY